MTAMETTCYYKCFMSDIFAVCSNLNIFIYFNGYFFFKEYKTFNETWEKLEKGS